MNLVVVAVVLTLAGAGISFHPSFAGTAWMWAAFPLLQAPLAILSLARLKKSGALQDMLQPKWGDISLGMISALVLLAASWAIRSVAAPEGSPREAWLFRAYLQAGDPRVLQDRWPLVALGIVAIASLTELAWRGLVLPRLEEKLGSRRAWPAAGLLYGLCFAPSAWWLRDQAGINVLILLAATSGGLVWSFLAVRSQRLVPSMMSHGVFLWFVVVQFRVLTLGT